MMKAFAATAAMIAVIVGIVIYRTGVYKEVTILPGQQGPYLLVFKEHNGEYHKIVPVIEEVEKYFKERGIECLYTFGRYLDDPNKVEHDRLKSHGGCVFATLSSDVDKAITESSYKTEKVPQKEYVIARFNGSPSVGPFVVYPKIDQWFEKYGYIKVGPAIELYKILPDNTVMTSYLFEYTID